MKYLPENRKSFSTSKWVKHGKIIREKASATEPARYDFYFEDQDGYGVTIQGLSRMFLKEYWNYAKLISVFYDMECRYPVLLI